MKRATYLAIISLLLISCIVCADGSYWPIFGPQTFCRDKGAPVVEHVVFDSPISGTAILRIENGLTADGDATRLVSSAIIGVNGKDVAVPNMFNQQVEQIEVPVELDEGLNTLDVELRSGPESCLTISILIEAGEPS